MPGAARGRQITFCAEVCVGSRQLLGGVWADISMSSAKPLSWVGPSAAESRCGWWWPPFLLFWCRRPPCGRRVSIRGTIAPFRVHSKYRFMSWDRWYASVPKPFLSPRSVDLDGSADGRRPPEVNPSHATHLGLVPKFKVIGVAVPPSLL